MAVRVVEAVEAVGSVRVESAIGVLLCYFFPLSMCLKNSTCARRFVAADFERPGFERFFPEEDFTWNPPPPPLPPDFTIIALPS